LKLNSNRVLVAVAGYVSAAAWALLLWDTRGLPSSVYGSPGPGVWPRIVFILMLAVSLVLGYASLRSSDERPVFESGTGLAIGLMGLAILYLVAIEPVGFLLTTALFLFASMLMLGMRSWRMLAGVSILFPVIVYFVFVKLANTEFPAGLLAPLLGS
jgi:putative tricarboxylic transport membrane protein